MNHRDTCTQQVLLGQRAQREHTYKRLARQMEGCVVRGSKRRGRRTGKPRTTVLTLGQPALPECPGLSQSHNLRPSFSEGVGKVTGLRGRQIWAQVSVKSWPSQQYKGGNKSTWPLGHYKDAENDVHDMLSSTPGVWLELSKSCCGCVRLSIHGFLPQVPLSSSSHPVLLQPNLLP